MNTDNGHLYVDDEVRAAKLRGEPLVELLQAEYEDLRQRVASERVARLAELRARPHRSRGSRRRAKRRAR